MGAIALLAFCLAPVTRCETLASVLTAHKIPADILSSSDTQQAITSYAVSSDSLPFLLAYYDDDGSGMLPAVLHVIRYDTRTDKLGRADLREGQETEPFRGFDQVMSHVSNICLGSALHISEMNGFITIDTHINPSAGCVLILNSKLEFSAGLFGWVRAKIDGDIIFEENTIHFASTHPSHLSIYDPQRKDLNRLFPAMGDVERTQFSAELRKHLPSAEWCAEQNNPCDPDSFTSDIGPVIVDDREQSFAFNAQMSPEGFGDDAMRSVKPRTIHYVVTRKNGRWLLTSQ